MEANIHNVLQKKGADSNEPFVSCIHWFVAHVPTRFETSAVHVYGPLHVLSSDEASASGRAA